MKIHHYFPLFFILLFFNCSNKTTVPVVPNIIPKPLMQRIDPGFFVFDDNVEIQADSSMLKVANYLTAYLKESYNLTLLDKKNQKKILFKIDSTITNKEGYSLRIEENNIFILAKTSKGAFYGVQSLLQLLPIESNSKKIAIQCLVIKDAPQFAYRGMHLDVARHFFSVSFIKKYIDLIAMLKMNTFHWHLTEDQGWRIEIKKYPKLQEIAAYRNETLMGHYSDQPQKFDGKKYGGFYTQEEIKELVRYALVRQVTIIPEIEMPGHSQAAIGAYPELGCTGKQINVATTWGVFDDIYCPKETTFQFLEDVIDEVVELFPGKYIHIGGDEAPKTRWKNCAHCQHLIKKEGLKDENGLQSYFITRMEKYINSKGKQLIGWDEILEGGLAPNATVMSWRGNKGAIEAAKQKHPVILTPNAYCYFDHYQSDNENEPLAIGGYLPLEKVYHFNPVPEELSKEEARYVLGAQGNIWTEYLSTPEKVEYMALPRMIALSEVVWTEPSQKNYPDFIDRLEHFNQRLDFLKVNYANHLYDIKGELRTKDTSVSYQLTSNTLGKNILFTTDHSKPNSTSHLYKNPIHVDSSMTIKAAVFNAQGTQLGRAFDQKIQLHKAVGKDILLNTPPNKAYNAGGKQALINGISGSNKRYGDKEWLGFSGEDVEITIHFNEPTAINKISTRFYNGNGQWIYAPKNVLISFDGKNFENFDIENSSELTVKFNQRFKHRSTEILRIRIPNYGTIPEGKQGAEHKAWTFIDELIVE
jgi:hexosaminidase